MPNFPSIVENRLYQLQSSERDAFLEEYNRRKKSIFIGYILLILFGWHYAYVNKWGTQILCWVTVWGLLIWWIIDWFRIPIIIGRYNKDLSVKIMMEMSMIYGNNSTPNDGSPAINFKNWSMENPGKSVNDFYKNR